MNASSMLRVLPKFAALSAVSALAAFSLPAAAQSAGDNIVNIGWFHLTTDDSSEPLRQTSPGSFAVPGSGASVGNADTLGLALTHFVTDNFALTADLGIPPKFKLDGAGTLASQGQLGTAKQWSPAILAKWYFGDRNSQLRPFVGVGVTRVWYSGVKLSRNMQTLAAGATGTATADLSSSWAPVANIGLTYNIDQRWSLGFSVSYIPLETEADITGRTAGGATLKYRTKLQLDPTVTFLSLGYKF